MYLILTTQMFQLHIDLAPALCLTFQVLWQFHPLSIPPHIFIELSLIDRLNWRKYVGCNEWLQWMLNCCKWFSCQVGLDSFHFCQIKSVSRVLVTDAKDILEHFHFSMEKMVFTFRVTLDELVGIRRKDKSEFTYRINPCFKKSTGHWSAI